MQSNKELWAFMSELAPNRNILIASGTAFALLAATACSSAEQADSRVTVTETVVSTITAAPTENPLEGSLRSGILYYDPTETESTEISPVVPTVDAKALIDAKTSMNTCSKIAAQNIVEFLATNSGNWSEFTDGTLAFGNKAHLVQLQGEGRDPEDIGPEAFGAYSYDGATNKWSFGVRIIDESDTANSGVGGSTYNRISVKAIPSTDGQNALKLDALNGKVYGPDQLAIIFNDPDANYETSITLDELSGNEVNMASRDIDKEPAVFASGAFADDFCATLYEAQNRLGIK